MEFEITSEGELIKYHGKGGDVVIPEGVKFLAKRDVFSSKTRIKSIFLPKSFIGHHYSPYYYRYVFEWSEKEQKVVKRYYDEGRTDLSAQHNNLYAYLCHMQLPYLISYKVHEDNVVYSERDGLLYSKDKRYLLGVPSKSTANIVFEDAECNISYAAVQYLKPKVIKAEFHGDFLSTKTVYCAKELQNKTVALYLPNVTRVDKYLREKEVYEDAPPAILIAPKLNLDEVKNYVSRQVALGYCLEPQLFDEVQAHKCQEVLAEEEVFLHKYALGHKLSNVVDAYKSIWDKWLLKDRQLSCEEDACRYLFDAVIYGTDEQVRTTLDTLDYDFWGRHKEYGHRANYNGAQILAVACRYGGVNKLKALLDTQKFCSAKTKEAPVTSIDYFLNTRLYLFCCGYPHFCSYDVSKDLAVTEKDELRDRHPLSEDQRIDCIELLIKRFILDKAKLSILCFFALMEGEQKIASFLRTKGAVFTDFYSYVDGHLPYYDYEKAVKYSIQTQNNGLSQLVSYLREDNAKIRLSERILTNLLTEHSDLLFEIFDCLEIAPAVMSSLISKCITKNLGSLLIEFIKRGKIKTKASLERYIDLSISNKASEITAILLEYKKTTFDIKRSKRASLRL
ncbi:MAG: hypothetical protein Q4A68_02460 [Anaerobiospirillum succiniciproducens]|uniref:hypothetical protein n=1 Tax=Anaerobiospirillum succiniciproducens TaxID=13335 RepID=UPI0026DCAEAD|nr:hypothetical protein [Anaerobiospirillum succiniciproducens]MDO4675433.1 hypothetical protein [Anaerobiospirillum succiniciproducens]